MEKDVHLAYLYMGNSMYRVRTSMGEHFFPRPFFFSLVESCFMYKTQRLRDAASYEFCSNIQVYMVAMQ